VTVWTVDERRVASLGLTDELHRFRGHALGRRKDKSGEQKYRA